MSPFHGTGAVAASVLVAAWVVASTALLVLGLGLALAVLVAWIWQATVARRLSVTRLPLGTATVEGEPLRLAVTVQGPRWLASSLVWRDRVGTLGERSADVAADGSAAVVLDAVPRGRYHVGPGALLAVDPLGLGRLVMPVDLRLSVTVRPRVTALSGLFTDGRGRDGGARRSPGRRASGPEPRGVRQYVEGEPLRAVHWPTSARRNALMVRELDDPPQERVAIVLDVDAAGVAGRPGDTSLDDAVRAAAALVRAHVVRGHPAALVIGTADPVVHRISRLGHEWDLALDALAAAEGCRNAPLPHLLATRGDLGDGAEVVMVTARPEAVADALVARAVRGYPTALVAVDALTYAGRQAIRTTPSLLRLAGAGVALVVLRHGTPLTAALEGMPVRAVG